MGRPPGSSENRFDRDRDRREDVTFLAGHGCGSVEVAERIGITRDALQKWCTRAAPDLMVKMIRNDYQREHSRPGAREGRVAV